MIRKLLPYLLTIIATTLVLLAAAAYFIIFSGQKDFRGQVTQKELSQLKDRVIVITGSSGGIGFALAQEAYKNGMKLVLADINPSKSILLAKEIQSQGGHAVALKTDLTLEADRKKLIEVAIENFGTIDILVNNAGYLYLSRPESMKTEKVRDVFELHLVASIDLVTRSLPYMKKKKYGHIVNIASILAHFPDISSIGQKGLNSIYTSSKAAVLSWSQVIQNTLREDNIKVTVVSPAGTRTGFWQNAVGPAQEQAIIESKVSWSLYDTPETIAKETFLGFLSDQSVIFPGNAQLVFNLLKAKNETESIFSTQF